MKAAAELAYRLRVVQGLAEKVLDRTPVWKNAMEDRFIHLLQEKSDAIGVILNELEKNPEMSDAIHKNLNIVYKGDETEKLLFQQWKRVAAQNNLVESNVLDELEEIMLEMKKELETAAPYVDELGGGREKTKYIIPALYRD